MKRLCVFYYRAFEWVGKPVEWIVCKVCQAKIRKGAALELNLIAPVPMRTDAEINKEEPLDD